MSVNINKQFKAKSNIVIMSRSFIKGFAHTKHVLKDKSTRDITLDGVAIRVRVKSIFTAGHGIYAYSTGKKDAI